MSNVETSTDRVNAVRERLESHGQAHLLRFLDDLAPPKQQALLDQIDRLDLDDLDELIHEYIRQTPAFEPPSSLEPAEYYRNDASGYDAQPYREQGEELIRAGKVAAFTVAGGQGTRLGWNGPKGTFPGTPVTGKPLFRHFAEQIRAAELKYGVTIPWYIMTSPINDADTRSFFSDNNCFGLNRRNIFMFPQGVMPSFDRNSGRILLAARHELAVNPDGHGGSIKALADSGATEDMASRGIEIISYFQVDNPLVKIVDPLFIGLHANAPDSSGEMSSKMVPKANPEEKVGVFCAIDARTGVVEYSDLPEELAQETDDDGNLRYIAGSIAIHLIGLRFVERLTADGQFSLPWHRAEKKVSHVDLETSEVVEPTQPNAVKLEAFVFDALAFAAQSIVYETSRQEEFAPIKNATGVDSVETSNQIQSNRNGAWLERHGVTVPRDDEGNVDALIEISPLTALEPADLRKASLPRSIGRGESVSL